MNIAIINQSGGKYLFEVPESITLKEGEKVKCDTRRGITDGIVWADSIVADEPAAKLIGKLLGAKFPLKSVVGKTVTSVEMFEQPKREPVKLYCTKDYKPGKWVTKGKIYEVDADSIIKFDDGYSTSFDGMPKPNSITDPLVPLVSRPAEVGEWVYIESKIGDCTYNNGDIGVVEMTYTQSGVIRAFGWQYVLSAEYLVLDGYKPEPEKTEPEYLNMRVVCVAGSNGFTVGKPYEFKNGVVVDDDGDVRPSNGDQKITSLSDAFLRDWGNKFIEFKGE